MTRGMWAGWCIMLMLLALGGGHGMAAVTATETRTVTITTDDTDTTVVAATANRTIRVTHLDVQNLGTTGKVLFQLCDGPCGTATSKIGPFELSAATATTQGGGWSFVCSGPNCAWTITPGNSLIGRVSTGATNNVRIHVTYEYYQR